MKPNVEKPAIVLTDHHQEFAQTFKRDLKSSNLTMKQIGVSKGYPYKPIPKPPNHENSISRKKPKVEKPASLVTDHPQEFAQMFKRGLKSSNLAMEQIGVSRGYPYKPIPKPPNQENPISRKKPEVGKPASLLADHHQEFAQMVRRGLKSSSLPMEQIGVSKGYPYKSIPKPPNQESPISRKKPNVEKPAINRFGNSETEKGQSSKSNNYPKFICEICVEPKTANDSFSIQGCTHAYCTDCMAKYVASKLQENITNIRCPVSGCGGLLEPEYCRSILPLEVFHRWGNALCEALILGSQKFYCPFKDCSAMLINDGGEVIRESECPYCRRLFCAHCKVPWHSGIDCNRFQTLHKDERDKGDIMLMKLAENKLWKRCPKCRIYVERTQGCKFMKCRCGTHFCYGCGTANISSQSHYCNYCRG